MKGRPLGIGVVLLSLTAGCSAPSSQVSPQVDGQIRDNLSRPLNAEELKQMGGGGQKPSEQQPGSAPAPMPAGKGPKGPASS